MLADGGGSGHERIKGIASIKPEFLVAKDEVKIQEPSLNDEDVESAGLSRLQPTANESRSKKRQRGQNKSRNVLQGREKVLYCENPRDESGLCSFGPNCKNEHDISKYLESKPVDNPGTCPVFAAIGKCPAGIKCRWLSSHYRNGVLLFDSDRFEKSLKSNYEFNNISRETLFALQRKKYNMNKSMKIIEIMDGQSMQSQGAENTLCKSEETLDRFANFVDGIIRPQEKKRLHYEGSKILSPLTTVGNLPFRRLMKTLGADVTFSEMALCMPLIQGHKAEWALVRGHSSEQKHFAVQIAASKPWHAIKSTQVLTDCATTISEININSGCPIDLLYKQGAGSALMDNTGKLLRMIHGVNAVSGDIPVTVKIRTGTKEGRPTAHNLVKRLLDDQGVACITIHGRSRAQRYTKEADWEYIKEIAELVREKREEYDLKPLIVGNGDIFSWQDWYQHIDQHKVDTCMVARGALIKPWIFEEIEQRQYLDKSASERLEYVKKFTNYGLEHWGSDQFGVNQTRRFLCEWLSFTHRYVPVEMLEFLPPKLNDRPLLWRGRNELETLLASPDSQDWIKISEMFLGPATDTFEFTPKHKSNSFNVDPNPLKKQRDSALI